jgi:DNA-binding MarR family transcriptional regulator
MEDNTCDGEQLEESLQIWVAFLRLHKMIVAELDAELEVTHRLPLSEFDVLAQLSRAPGHRLRMSELADAVLLSRSGLTRLIDRLERGGLVERQQCSSDRRGLHCHLTERGAALLDEARVTHVAGVQRRFSDRLSPDDIQSLGEAFARLLAAEPAPV